MKIIVVCVFIHIMKIIVIYRYHYQAAVIQIKVKRLKISGLHTKEP